MRIVELAQFLRLVRKRSPDRRALLRLSLQKDRTIEDRHNPRSTVPFLRRRVFNVHAAPTTFAEPLLPGFDILPALPKVAWRSDQSRLDIPTFTSSSIRAPRFDPLANDRHSSVSKELSWATDNRLLEMRSWLYQPFLYYAIHCGYPRDSATYPDVVAPGSRATFPRNILNDPAPGFSPEDTKILQTMISLGVETNLKILEVRSLRHRHYGLWYDLRFIMTASLLLLALVRSGNGSLIPGGLEELVGHHPELLVAGSDSQMNGDRDIFDIGGKFKMVFGAFEFWADSSADLRGASRVLRELVRNSGDGNQTEVMNGET